MAARDGVVSHSRVGPDISKSVRRPLEQPQQTRRYPLTLPHLSPPIAYTNIYIYCVLSAMPLPNGPVKSLYQLTKNVLLKLVDSKYPFRLVTAQRPELR